MQKDLKTGSPCSVSSLVCASLASSANTSYIYACTGDARIVKLDTRMPDEPVRVYEDDRFCNVRKYSRLSLSTMQRYAAVLSENDKVIVFDLGLEGRHTVLSIKTSKQGMGSPGANSESLIDC